MIGKFSGKNRWLSNFWPAEVELDGMLYSSVEHAYQAAKTLNMEDRALFQGITAGVEKSLGKKLVVRDDWNEVKIAVMTHLNLQKYQNHPELAANLIATGDQQLVEGNTWGDVFWGVCNGVGENHLGKILMEIRKNIQQ